VTALSARYNRARLLCRLLKALALARTRSAPPLAPEAWVKSTAPSTRDCIVRWPSSCCLRSFEIVRHVRDLNPSVPRRLLHRVRGWTTLDRLVTAMSIDLSIQLADVHVRRRQRREEQQRIDDENQRVAARCAAEHAVRSTSLVVDERLENPHQRALLAGRQSGQRARAPRHPSQQLSTQSGSRRRELNHLDTAIVG
jgi:hypothetical protein